MNIKLLVAALALGSVALIGCKQQLPPAAMKPITDQSASAQALATGVGSIQRNVIEMPAFPVIRNAVFALVPMFGGQRHPEAMTQICGLAQGTLSQAQVDAFLKQRNLDPASLPRTGVPESLLVNGDQHDQIVTCAAYLATSVMLKTEPGEFMKAVQVADKPVKGAPQRGKTKAPATASSHTEQQLDKTALAQALPMKLALARTNAGIFTLIAAELQRHPGLTPAQQRTLAIELFARLAPLYLKQVNGNLPAADVRLELTRLQDDELAFRTSDGAQFEFDGSNLRLFQNDTLWLGNGKLMGQDYLTRVAYFTPAAGALLAPAVSSP